MRSSSKWCIRIDGGCFTHHVGVVSIFGKESETYTMRHVHAWCPESDIGAHVDWKADYLSDNPAYSWSVTREQNVSGGTTYTWITTYNVVPGNANMYNGMTSMVLLYDSDGNIVGEEITEVHSPLLSGQTNPYLWTGGSY